MIRLSVPSIDDDDLAAVSDVLRSGMLVQGERVLAFEAAMAALVGTRFAVAVANCTAALQLALLAQGVGAGDRIAVSTYSWPATANVIALCGAVPLFVDVEADTGAMAPAALERVLEGGGPVKAVLVVHPFGCMADMPGLLAVAERHGVPVIEDAACALGASLLGRTAGAWGRLGCFSFHPRKAVTTGEGGIVTTDDAALARRLRVLRNHGQDPESNVPDFIAPGFNLRLTEFQAALGSSQLLKLKGLLRMRRERAAHYSRLLAGSPIETPRVSEPERHVFQSYVVRLPTEVAPQREALIARLKARGIETTIGTYHMPLTSYFRAWGGFQPGDFPSTDAIASRALTLPLHAALSDADQEHVAAVLRAEVAACLRASDLLPS